MKLKILQSNFIVYFYCIVDRILFKFKKKNKNQIFLSFFFIKESNKTYKIIVPFATNYY